MADLNKNTIDFLNFLEGYHIRLKEIHWSTTNKAEHLLTDEIDGEILGYEDKIAEVVMGNLNTRFGIGDLKPMLSNSKDLNTLLNELEKDIMEFKENIGEEKKNSGIQNILDDFIENVNKWQYLKTFK